MGRGDVLLINTSRGGVVDEEALLEFLERHPQAACALDVWEGEPAIRVDLLRRSAIGTPHIAGYSLDARLRATTAVSRAVRSYFGIRTDPAEPALPVPEPAEVRVGPGQSECEALATAVLGSYDVRLDAARLRVLPELDAAERPTVEGLLEEAHCFNQSLATAAADERMARFLALGGQTRDAELHLDDLVDRL